MSKSEELRLTDDSIRRAVQNWQRRELSRFGSKLPPLLQPLAEELKFVPRENDPREQALLEDGWWSGGAHWVSHSSPISADDLRTKDAASVIEFVSNWKPSDKQEPEDIQGLLHALRTAITADVRWGDEVGREALGSGPVLIKTVILEGFRDAVRSNEPANDEQSTAARSAFSWPTAFALIEDAFAAADQLTEGPVESSLRSYLDVAIDLLGLTASSQVLTDYADRVSELLARGRALRAIWLAESATTVKDIEGVLIASLNTLSGQLVRATINVGLTQARLWREANAAAGDAVSPSISQTVGAALDDFLQKARNSRSRDVPFSPAGYGALGMLGEYIPQIGYLSPGWLRDNVGTLFDQVGDPMFGPAWAAYITRAVFSERVFALARVYYRNAALSTSPSDEKEGRWSTSEGLAQHVLISVLRGASTIEPEVDEVVALTFSRVPAASRAHAYWEVYRAWEDHSGPINDTLIRRAIAFWEWRLSELETEDASAIRATEAEGLLWFFLTIKVPADLSLDLTARTMKLLGKRATAHLTLFERLATTAEEFPDRTYDIAEVAVSLALASDYPYIPKEPLSIVLRNALKSVDPEVRDRARHLADKLFETTGDATYGALLGANS